MAQGPDGWLISTLPTYPVRGSERSAEVDKYGDIVSEFHERAVPEFAVEALDRLYGTLYASFAHLSLSDSAQPVPHTWIGYRYREVVAVLLFRVYTDQAVVLTEMFCLEQSVADAFCQALFARFGAVRTIHFNAVRLPQPLVGLAQQSYPFSENYIIRLPSSVDQYLADLGKSTRKTLRGYGNRLQRDFPKFEWEVHQACQLRFDELRTLLRRLQHFKRISLAARGKHAELSRRELARMLLLSRRAGLVGIARIGDKICGGSLAYRIGDHYVMLLSASDPAFASYRLGLLCCFWSVCDCIRAGGRECHLLWGRYQYKTQLLGEPHNLLRLTIYRSWWWMCLAPLMVCGMWLGAMRYRIRNWLLAQWSTQSVMRPAHLSRILGGWRGLIAKIRDAESRSV